MTGFRSFHAAVVMTAAGAALLAGGILEGDGGLLLTAMASFTGAVALIATDLVRWLSRSGAPPIGPGAPEDRKMRAAN